MQSLAWYLNRLSRMSAAEVGHRAHRALNGQLQRLGFRLVEHAPVPSIFGVSRGFLIAPAGVPPGRYIEKAKRYCSGKYSVFAFQAELATSSPEWNRDPLTGVLAPLQFGKRIDYRDERIVGNIKYLWEPNRHLELVTLAQAYALTGHDLYLRAIGSRLESWLDQCPYPMGVNWSSSLELGIRLINWSLVWQLIGQHESALFRGDDGQKLVSRWLDSIYQHAHFVRNNYSKFSSANNHLIGEAAGLYIATCTWPFWNEFEQWGREAREVLLKESESQTYPDGVNREQAIAYQQFVLDFLILSGLAGRAAGREFPLAFWRTIERMIEFIHSVMDVTGNVPMFGDADDGFVVRLSQEPDFCPFRSLLATGAILFDRPEFAAKAGKLDDKTRFLLGEDRWEALLSSELELRRSRREFPDGGYYILGTDLDSENEVRLIADAGPLGYLSIAAHGHADALSFVLSVAGREILVDPGTFSYHTEPHWRQYFRGTGAHNTVRIDGQDQSVQGGNFMWLRHARARCLVFRSEEQGGYFLGEHDGYSRLSDPVIHRREIVQNGTMIDVTDSIVSNGYHAVERCWHFSEDCDVSVEGSVIIADNGPVRVTVHAGETGEIRLLRASDEPPGGWVSRRFDVKVPSTSVYFLDETRGTTSLKTRIECRINRKDS